MTAEAFICDCCLSAVLSVVGVERPCVRLESPSVLRLAGPVIGESGHGAVRQPVTFQDIFVKGCSIRTTLTQIGPPDSGAR
jgi:hypothetical protein